MDMNQQKKLHSAIINREYYKDYEDTDSAAIIIDNRDFSVSALALKASFPLIRLYGSRVRRFNRFWYMRRPGIQPYYPSPRYWMKKQI
jgi:hypothetical protein